ncbi:MAG: hypothetical protein Ct9H300mP25_02580 [Acidobacteriota bacterium]|nr:MAG: hypothetical protein Ct9H300mP25_02580 [Acidobacteriota bacterium]
MTQTVISGLMTGVGRSVDRWMRHSDVDPILKFNRDTGEVMASFGAGLFVLPHGLHVDTDGNVWVTDSMGNEAGTKGHQVFKILVPRRHLV